MTIIPNDSVYSSLRGRSVVYLLYGVWVFIFVSVHCTVGKTEQKNVVDKPTGQDEGSTEKIVIVCSAFEEADGPSIERSIRSQSADLPVDLLFQHVAEAPSSVSDRNKLGTSLMARFGATAAFIIYPDESQVRLQILLKTIQGIQVSQRSVDVSGGTPLREALGVIVRAATTTILNTGHRAAGHSGQQSQEPENESREPAPLLKQSREPKTDSLDELSTSLNSGNSGKNPGNISFSLGGAAGWMAKGEMPWFGMDLSLGVSPGMNWTVYIGTVFFSRVKAHKQDVVLAVHQHPIRLGAGLRRPLRRVVVTGGVSFVWNYSVEKTEPPDSQWTVLGDGSEVAIALAGFFELGAPIHGSLYFFGRFAVDVLLYAPEYQISVQQTEQEILKPMLFQPNIVLGLKFYFI